MEHFDHHFFTKLAGIITLIGIIAIGFQIYNLVTKIKPDVDRPSRVQNISDFTYVERSFPF